MKKRKIVFYIGSLYKGGAERVVTNLAYYFDSKGYDIIIVTKLRETVEYTLPDGVRRILADITREEEKGRVQNLFLRIKKLRKIFLEINPDVVVSFIGKSNLMSIAATRGTGIPVVVSVRSNPAREIGNGFKRLLTFIMFHMAEGVILQTTEAKEFFPKNIQNKAVVLHNSINPQFIRTPFMGKKRKEIVTVGRIDLNKNQIMLIEAFAKLANEFPEWSVAIYGEGPARIDFEKRVQELGMKERIVFKGVHDDIPEKIEDASIFVMTSKQEGMPNALMEAMVLGLAVISTDCPCGGPRDLITHEINGILIPVNDIEGLARELKLLMKNEQLREKLGQNALLLKEKVMPELINSQWEEYLNNIINQKVNKKMF